jgi:hypothetical protein
VIIRIIAICLLCLFGSSWPSFAATYYASATGSGTTCSSGSPCTLSYTIATKSQSGDTIEVASGAYSGDFTLSKTNVIVTISATNISTLGTFTKGIPTGTDVRPVITGSFTISATGVTLSYMRINGGTRSDDQDASHIDVDAENTTVSYCDVYNGAQGIRIHVGRLVTVTNCYVHALGLRGTSLDVHGIAILRGSASATGWADAIQLTYNSIIDTGGDAIQDQSACTDYGGAGTLDYIIIDNNVCTDHDEQCVDMKGTRYVRISNNNFYATDQGLIYNTTPSDDCSGARHATLGWEIYNNILHDTNDQAINTITGGYMYASGWKIYNNLIYNNCKAAMYNQCSAVVLGGGGDNEFYENTLYNNVRTSGSYRSGGINACSNGAGVKNNIFYNNGTESGSFGNIASGTLYECTTSGTPTYNYVYPTTNGQTGSNAITSSDPGLTSALGHDFTLLTTSVNKDSGTDLGTPYNVDILGGGRPTGAAYDRGAYEFGASGSQAVPINFSGGSVTGGAIK